MYMYAAPSYYSLLYHVAEVIHEYVYCLFRKFLHMREQSVSGLTFPHTMSLGMKL